MCDKEPIVEELGWEIKTEKEIMLEEALAEEPVIENLELPFGDELHKVIHAEVIAQEVFYRCECGVFGYVMSNIKECTRCHRPVGHHKFKLQGVKNAS